ncbi:MAG: hypothetical protein LQ339_006760 [Xanthoria mediterranea]|nr:MAG: hypothetical protein LQ339_006760 [Xanthoria mediterranea]
MITQRCLRAPLVSTKRLPSIHPSILPFQRSYATSERSSDKVPTNDPNPPAAVQNVSDSNAVPISAMGLRDAPLQELPEDSEKQRQMQAPNRSEPWSRSQQPRERAMSGPRFEQTIMEYQPQPQAAIELIHKQPVRWTKQRVVSCDGGGGPMGHPRIFINVDKPQINWCTYCGLPFAKEHHREVPESQRVSDEPFAPR